MKGACLSIAVLLVFVVVEFAMSEGKKWYNPIILINFLGRNRLIFTSNSQISYSEEVVNVPQEPAENALKILFQSPNVKRLSRRHAPLKRMRRQVETDARIAQLWDIIVPHHATFVHPKEIFQKCQKSNRVFIKKLKSFILLSTNCLYLNFKIIKEQ